MSTWSGRTVERARRLMATRLPAPCARCGVGVGVRDEWHVGHVKSRLAYPELTNVVSNWQIECAKCSWQSSSEAHVEKAIRDGVVARVGDRVWSTPKEGGFSPTPATRADPNLPFSPPGTLPGADGFQPPLDLGLPAALGNQFEVRAGLEWDPDRVRLYPWLEHLADVPEDASPPLYMTYPPEAAVGSYGSEPCDCHNETAVEWIERVERKALRWWQNLAVVRQLEHDAGGALVHTDIVESASRRSGKSVRMRGVALWRMEHAALFDNEPQLVMHTGSDVAICREIQRGAWHYAESRWGRDSVTKANGKEQIESTDGHRWLVRAQTAVYGYDVTYALVDEGWDVKPETVDEGLEPATLERVSPQVHRTSTAHRRATSLMRAALVAILTADDPTTLLLLWGARQGSDISDPAVWRTASPHWSESRRRLIASKYEKAKAGQADPQADDPDPLAGFAAQYLNIWRLGERAVVRGDALVSVETFGALTRKPIVDGRRPDACAIEAWHSAGVSVAVAWRLDELEQPAALVGVNGFLTLADAADYVRAIGFRGRVTVGKSLVDEPALRGIRKVAGDRRVVDAALTWSALMRDGQVFHDGGEHLAEQVLELRTMRGPDGLRVVSTGRADAVKAAGWAAQAALLTRSVKRRVILPTGV